MERRAYPVDEKLFSLLVEENFDELNTDELQTLFDNLPYEISDKWVFISDKTERQYQSEFENHKVDYFQYSRLYGYKYFSLIDYGSNSTYKIGIPDVSESNDAMDRQKSVTIDKRDPSSEDIIQIKKYIFERLANETQINNYLINNIEQILMKSFTDFFHDEFGKIQNHFKQNNDPTEHENPFFVTYGVDLEQFQEHKNVVAEKLHILKDIIGINIKEVFFKPYRDKDLVALINIELKIMDLVRAINECMRADASLYLEWQELIYYNRFDSQMLSQYRKDKPDKENIKNVKQIISDELKDFSDDWYDNESLILSSKKRFGFRSRQLIDKICNSLRNFISFIYHNVLKVLKLCFRKLSERYNKIRLSIRESEWIRVGISYTFLAIVTAFFQAPLSNLDKIKAWFQSLFQRFFAG